jgi:hypothetical protein
VIRFALFLTLALAMSTADSGRLLCQAFCGRTAATEDADACHHETPGAELSVSHGIDCAAVDLRAIVNVREIASQSTPPAPDEAITASVSNGASAAAFGRAFASLTTRPASATQPRTVALRI